MSKKATITDEMIVSAAFDIARSEGAENVNARSIAKKIGCTTQPVLYHFSSVMEIKEEVYRRADELHTEYIGDIRGRYDDPMLEMGMQYIRFAAEEGHLFRLLFQSNKFESKSFGELISSDESLPMISLIAESAGLTENAARELFSCIFLPAHGIASLIANNAMVYDEKHITEIMTRICSSIIKDFEGE